MRIPTNAINFNEHYRLLGGDGLGGICIKPIINSTVRKVLSDIYLGINNRYVQCFLIIIY